MHDYLHNASRNFKSLHVEKLISEYAEDAKLPDNSFDAAITTHVLCSVEDVSKVVEAIYATLKPGASYYFLEHVEAPQERPWLQKAQHWIQPLWGRAADHCHVIRRPQDEIRRVFGAGNVEVDPFVADVPTVLMPIEPHIVGRATKPK
jgi:ubiquinone/menaquinone biosynthesis C-methylase UbiE